MRNKAELDKGTTRHFVSRLVLSGLLVFWSCGFLGLWFLGLWLSFCCHVVIMWLPCTCHVVVLWLFCGCFVVACLVFLSCLVLSRLIVFSYLDTVVLVYCLSLSWPVFVIWIVFVFAYRDTRQDKTTTTQPQEYHKTTKVRGLVFALPFLA